MTSPIDRKPREFTATLVLDISDGVTKFAQLKDAEGFFYKFSMDFPGAREISLIEKSAYDDQAKRIAELEVMKNDFKDSSNRFLERCQQLEARNKELEAEKLELKKLSKEFLLSLVNLDNRDFVDKCIDKIERFK